MIPKGNGYAVPFFRAGDNRTVEKGRKIWVVPVGWDMVWYMVKSPKKGGIPLKKMKMLIADSSDEFVTALGDLVRGAYILRSCREGREALAMLNSFQPDLVVLDLMLPGLDGVSILRQAAATGLRPMVLATSRYVSDYVVEAMMQLGVGYLMVKPCDVRATVARLGELSQRLRQPLFTQPDPRTAVSNILLSLGVPTKLRGYAYLRESILEKIRDPGQSVTKELYPTVAAVCCATPMQVERSIRSAIATAWTRRDDGVWQLYFPAPSDGISTRPTNGAFISRLADAVALSIRAGTEE